MRAQNAKDHHCSGEAKHPEVPRVEFESGADTTAIAVRLHRPEASRIVKRVRGTKPTHLELRAFDLDREVLHLELSKIFRNGGLTPLSAARAQILEDDHRSKWRVDPDRA